MTPLISQSARLMTILALLTCTACLAAPKTLTVAADGTGDYKTIQEAIAAVPINSADRTTLHIKPGTYQGQIILPKSKSNVTFEGDDIEKTVLTFALNTNEPNPPEVQPQYKGTGVVILGDDFHASNVTFQNTSGDHGQALALRVDGDRAVFQDCRLLGWQDTLMVNNSRQYFHNCYIEGRVDFIYGSGTAVFDHCEIHSKNGGHITAANTPQDHPYGFVFLNCKLTGDPNPWIAPDGTPANKRADPKADLGRPWRPYASVTYLNCEMGSHILPAGWNNWGKTENESTARYSEYQSAGPGANPSQRVPWSKQLTKEDADKITIKAVLGGTDNWDPAPTVAAPRKASIEMNLWPGNLPGMVPGATPGADDGTGRYRNVGIPGMLVYLPDAKPAGQGRMAIIVCPGGGYTHLTRLVGADGAVEAFLPKNVVVISLKYRLLPPSTQVEVDAREDGKRAVRLVRYHAKEWGIDPNKIGVLGWSAGANLALNVGTHFDTGVARASDPVERQSSRPNFVVLLSPWPNSHTADSYPAPKNAPPAFIGSAKDDTVAPVTFAEQIAANYQKVSPKSSLWIVDTGGHGAFTIDAPGEGGKWIERFWPWLTSIGLQK